MSIPNSITLFRILLIPFFFTSLVSYHEAAEHNRITALVIFFIAALSDAVDGFLARMTKNQTDLGRFLDPLADKLLLLSGFLGLLFVEALPLRPPLWITVTIVFRDLVVVGGMVCIFIMNGQIQVKPNLLGKATTALQMTTLIAILLTWKISVLLWYLTAIFTILSCLSYVLRDVNKLKDKKT